VSAPPFRHTIRVRFNECDPQGVVFNGTYLTYFDVALTEMWREAFGSYAAMVSDHGVDIMLVQSNVGYRAPARPEDLIDVELAMGRIGTTSLRLDGRILRDGEVLTVAELHYVVVDPGSYSKLPVPDAMRAALAAYAA